MIWPERAAVGLWAILSVALVGLYANEMIGAVPQAHRLENVLSWVRRAPAPKELTHEELFNAKGLLTDEEVGIVPARKADIGDLASLIVLKAGVYCALPIWLVLRVVDFVIGGPMRRRQMARSRS